MLNCAQYLLLIFCFIVVANGAKILFAAMPVGRSHAGSFMPFMHRLVADGHEVTVFFEIFRPEIPLGGGVKENLIMLKGKDLSIDIDRDFNEIVWTGSFRAITMAIPYYESKIICGALLENQIDDFYRLSNQTFDIVLTDSLFATCGYALALLSKKPYILMHTTDLESAYSYIKGYNRNFATVTPTFLDYSYPEFDVNQFLDRVSALSGFFELYFAFTVPANYLAHWTIGHIVDFSMIDYISQSTFSFYEMPEYLVWPTPIANDLVSTGAYCRTAKPLNNEFERFVADPKSKGTIVIAFGTICKWEYAPKYTVDAFVDTLNRLSEYRIIWGYDGPKIDRLKDHVMTDPWIPQESLLQDKRTKLFVSHGGLKSVKEAICSETPVVYMPMFAEQLRNSWLARTHNFAEFVNKKNLTAAYLEQTMRKILNDDRYQNSVSQQRKILLDRPIGALDSGAYWLRRLLKYGGRMPEYFYRTGAKQNSFVYFYLDAISLFAITVGFIGLQTA